FYFQRWQNAYRGRESDGVSLGTLGDPNTTIRRWALNR
ncbi:unnamed protein product, partial [marine sediment metagenome]